MITKGQTIKVNGVKVVVDSIGKSKFGNMVYFQIGQEYCWVYEAELEGK